MVERTICQHCEQTEIKWRPVLNLPPTGLMVLVTGPLHKGVALGCCDAAGHWDVQPYKGAWYQTVRGIERWAYIKLPVERKEDDR